MYSETSQTPMMGIFATMRQTDKVWKRFVFSGRSEPVIIYKLYTNIIKIQQQSIRKASYATGKTRQDSSRFYAAKCYKWKHLFFYSLSRGLSKGAFRTLSGT